MGKKYLITSFSNLNYKSFKNFIFADEYLFRLYQKENLKIFVSSLEILARIFMEEIL